MGQNNVVVRFENVAFGYSAEKPLLDEANFSVRENTKLTLMGQNGAGKSTIFKLITGELKPVRGNIHLLPGATIATAKQVMAREHLTETVHDYFAHAFTDAPYNINKRIADALEAVNFSAPLDKTISDFSGGQQARLLLAYALIQEPDILLLDEPTNNLDRDGIDHLTAFLIMYPKTVLVISHDADFLNSFTEGVLHLDIYTGKVEKYDGNYTDEEYKERALERALEEPPSTYYPSALTSRYATPIVEPEMMPATAAGDVLASGGLDLQKFNYTFRQLSAKLLQLFMLVGILAVLYKREWFYRLPHLEFILMGIGSLIILSAIIVLPVLSVEYGLLRAFQQSLMFLGICIVIGSASLLYFLQERWRILFAGTLAIIFLLSSTGVFTQLIGGYDAQLHLNNAGRYYDLYYVHESELQAIEWLAGEVEKDAANGIETTIQGDHYALEAASALQEAYVISDIYPALVRRDAYVFLGVSNNRTGQATASYNQTSIGYHYPIEFLEATKSL